MRFTVRLKLILLIVSALLTLALVIGQSELIGARSRERLFDIEGRLLPRMEVGPRIEAEFLRLGREFQDAAAAQDMATLHATLSTRNRIFELLAGAGPAIAPSAAAQLRWAIQDYYESATAVTTLLIQGETGEQQLQQVAEMQRRLRKAEEVLLKTTAVDQTEISSAFSSARHISISASQYRLSVGIAGVLVVLLIGYWASSQMLRSLEALSSGFARFSTGDFREPVKVGTNDELSDVAREANSMAKSLADLANARDKDDWVKSGQVELADKLRGNLDPNLVAERTLRLLVRKTSAVAGALYLLDGPDTLRLAGSYARDAGAGASWSEGLPAGGRSVKPSFAVGEGLVGAAFFSTELTVTKDVPSNYFRVVSGLGEALPTVLVFLPINRGEANIGVVELALLGELDPAARELLVSVRDTLAVTFDAAKARFAREALLVETQLQAERLSAQEEELRQNNQELAVQQEELRRANDELEAQRSMLSERNHELDLARKRVMEKVEELGRVSLYKSQFLANMSHELRTPLNSMLLLSHLLTENSDQNLTAKQVEYAATIHSAGEDLLQLINQVLDLSKIEAGKQEVNLGPLPIAEMVEGLSRIFRPLAEDKRLVLRTAIEQTAPERIETDRSRVERILTNLLGNAIKFTEKGSVTLTIGRPGPEFPVGRPDLDRARAVFFSVSDTGIGIPAAEQERIFVPFEQIESGAARRYQGTGLGLSIARESALLLGGELVVASVAGAGSTFTLILPEAHVGATHPVEPPNDSSPVIDDRAQLAPADPHILVVEDDPVLSEQLLDIIHARGLKALLAQTGEQGLALAKRHQPRGIVLDVKLPDIDGWTVLERLRAAPDTKAIPVHFLSAIDAPSSGLARGAVGYLTKPATRAELINLIIKLSPPGATERDRRVLIVEDHPADGQSLLAALEAERFDAVLVPSAAEALSVLGHGKFSCIVLDLGLPDMDGLALLEELRKRPDCAGVGIVVHTGRSLTKKETRELEAYAEAVVLKDESSLRRLLEELRLFVHHIQTVAPAEATVPPTSGDRLLEGLRVIVAEDDMRTAYSLIALLQSRGCHVRVAENGKEALTLIERDSSIDCVLMDIMMPEMDGYETMRAMRARPALRTVPIIALTAKAMPGERERCLAAGATDYLTKPVDGAKLLSALHRYARPTEADSAR